MARLRPARRGGGFPSLSFGTCLAEFVTKSAPTVRIPILAIKNLPTRERFCIARLRGFEPLTFSVTGRRANQLRYSPKFAPCG